MGIYVGLKEKMKPEIFESDVEATREAHPKYDVIYAKTFFLTITQVFP